MMRGAASGHVSQGHASQGHAPQGQGPRAAIVSPPALRPGDAVFVVAPSSPFEAVRGWKGLAFLRERYRVRFQRDAFTRAGYLAGSDDRRRAELARALRDPDVRAVLAFRGGVGATRFAAEIDFGSLRADPKWIVGFSDITALHVECARVGVASLHAPHVASLGRCDAAANRDVPRALEAPHAKSTTALLPWRSGVAQGPLAGGNLAILHDCAASGRLALPDGAVLFLEDVGERPYRLDRMLTALVRGGHLARVAGVVLGDFTDCHPGPDRVGFEAVLRDALAPLGVPMAAGFPAGHGEINRPLVLGADVVLEVDEARATLEVGVG